MTDSIEWTISPVLYVTTNDDVVPDDGVLSLREALALAATEDYPINDEITFAPWMDHIQLDEQLVIDSDVEIIGPRWESLAIDAGGDDYRVFLIDSGVEASVSGVTITGGRVTGTNDGGGIFTYGDLTLESVCVTGNEAGE